MELYNNYANPNNRSETFNFEKLPENADQLMTMPEARLNSPFMTAALTVLACCRYEYNQQECIDMLNFLQGPKKLAPIDIQFLRDRLSGKGYVPRSYLAGTNPQNNYTPTQPYTVTVEENPYSYTNEGYATLYIRSSGADSPRQVTLRQKGNGQWFLWQNMLLPDIRIPINNDPWA